MKFHCLILCCILQSISGFNVNYLNYQPNVASARIVNGKDAPDGIAPYQCSLQLYREHICGCAIISNKYILSASHCLSGYSIGSLEILVGTNDKTNGGTFYKIENYTTHEKHNKPRFAYDIGVARIEETIEFNDKVKPIELSSEEVPEDAEVTLTGWGQLGKNADEPDRLQIVQLKVIQTENCRKIFGNGSTIHDGQLCTDTKGGKGFCMGDSGGPLVYKNKVVGVVNSNIPCARGYPDKYTKIAYFYDWIQQHMV